MKSVKPKIWQVTLQIQPKPKRTQESTLLDLYQKASKR